MMTASEAKTNTELNRRDRVRRGIIFTANAIEDGIKLAVGDGESQFRYCIDAGNVSHEISVVMMAKLRELKYRVESFKGTEYSEIVVVRW